MTRRYEEGGEANLTAQSTLFCLLLLPGSLSRCALNGGEHSWVERIEMRLVCVRVCPKREAQMLGCWRPIRGSFQVFFHLRKMILLHVSVTCCDEAAVSLLKQCLRSVGEELKHLWLLCHTLGNSVQLSCWEVGYHHFFFFFAVSYVTSHVFMCVRKCHDLLKWVYTMVIGDGGSVGCWKVTALMIALSFWQNVTV